MKDVIVATVKSRDVIRLLHADGWRLDRIRGSHHHFKNPVKPGVVAVPAKKGREIPLGTVRSILRRAGLGR